MARTQEADSSIMEASGLDRQRNPDDNLSVRFSLEPMENVEKSKEQGRPIFDDTEIIEIRVPGDADIRRHPVSREDKARFPRQYQAWKANQDQDVASGTPLIAWPMIKRSQVEEAKFFGVHTVEQLAEVADVNLQRLGPGWITLRSHAIDWLKKAQDGALLGKLRAELEERDRRLSALEDLLKKQAEELHRNPRALSATASIDAPPAPIPNADLEALKLQVAQLLARTATVIEPPKTLAEAHAVAKAPIIHKKRGRPSKADLAAREAAKNGKE